MNMLVRATRLGLALAATGALPLVAQQWPDFSLKLRTGNVSGSVQDATSANRVVGVAVEASAPFMGGNLVAEFGYENYNGYFRETTRWGVTPYFCSNQQPYNPIGIIAPGQSWDGYDASDPSAVKPVDSRFGAANRVSRFYLTSRYSFMEESNRYQGVGLRVGYRAKMPSWAIGWEWQAGLTLDWRQTHHEVRGTLTPQFDCVENFGTTGAKRYTGERVNAIDGALSSDNTARYYEGMAFAKNEVKFQPGAYVGVSKALDEIFRFDANLRYTGFSAISYNPFTYTGRTPYYTNVNKSGVVLEVALGIKI